MFCKKEVMSLNKDQAAVLNSFFVNVFNRILSWEEQALKKVGQKNLSVRELHVIEAVHILKSEAKNTMANIANLLSVSPGSLTTAVNVLVKKGYLQRSHSEKDRRVVYIDLTENGETVNSIHENFHSQMIEAVDIGFNEKELNILISALEKLKKFFSPKL